MNERTHACRVNSFRERETVQGTGWGGAEIPMETFGMKYAPPWALEENFIMPYYANSCIYASLCFTYSKEKSITVFSTYHMKGYVRQLNVRPARDR